MKQILSSLIFLLSGCAVIEPVITLDSRIIYPIPKELRVDDYESKDGYVWVNDTVVALIDERFPGGVQAKCASLGGPVFLATVACTYWDEGDQYPTIVVHRGASDYTVRHEIAHALQFQRGWGASTVVNHFGVSPE